MTLSIASAKGPRGQGQGQGLQKCLFGGVVLMALFLALPLYAQGDVVEKRLNAISSELRCLVCQNESLASSNAELAHDLRREIRTLINAGQSDGDIMDFMVVRYGDFVRYRPPLKATTLLLWFGPALLFISGLIVLVRHLRHRERLIDPPALSTEEQGRADQLLDDAQP